MRSTFFAVVVALALVLGFPAPLAEAGEVVTIPGTCDGTPLNGTSVCPPPGSRDEDTNYTTSTWAIDVAATLETVQATGLLSMWLGPDGFVDVELAPSDLFLPGEQRIDVYDNEGAIVAVEALDVWPFIGHPVDDPFAPAAITFDDVGIYGYVTYLGRDYHVAPTNDGQVDSNGLHLQNVTWLDNGAPRTPWLPASPQIDDCPGIDCLSASPPPGGAGIASHNPECWHPSEHSGWQKLCPKPAGAKKFRDKHSNWATRITSGYNVQQSMWQSYASIEIQLWSIAAVQDYATTNSCAAHRNAWESTGPYNYLWASTTLFVGHDIGSGGALGCAVQADRCTVGWSSWGYDTYNVVLAVDYYGDGYDPDYSKSLGLVTAHETGHTWGELHNGAKNSNNKYNPLVSQWQGAANMDFWWTLQQGMNFRDAARYDHCR